MTTIDIKQEKSENLLASKYFSPYNTSCMRGGAILLVILCHMVGTFFDGRIVYFTPLGGIGVAIFLMLSAYGLNESYKKHGLSNWWKKRLMAVWVPYFIIECSLYWPFHEWNFFDFLKDITFLRPLYENGWYLNYLAICYIMFYLIMNNSFTRKYKIAFWGILSIVSFFVLSPIRAEQSLSFFAGLIFSEKKEKQGKLNWKSGSVFIIFSVIFLVLKQTSIIRNAPQVVYNFAQLMIKLPCGIGVCGWIISVNKKISLKFLDLVGKISYELYLVHGYILSMVPINIGGAIVFVLVSTIVTTFFYYIVEIVKKQCGKIFKYEY